MRIKVVNQDGAYFETTAPRDNTVSEMERFAESILESLLSFEPEDTIQLSAIPEPKEIQ